MNEERFRRGFLLLLVLGISLAFLAIIRGFLLTILLAAITAGLASPLYRRLLGWMGGRRLPAAGVTMLAGLLMVGAPIALVIGMVTREAVKVAQSLKPAIQQFANEPTALAPIIDLIPYADELRPYREQVLLQAADLAHNLGGIIVSALSTTTVSTVTVLVQFFIFLYTLFFLLMDGPRILGSIKQFVPLRETDRDLLFDRFLSVARATIKGTIVIGIIQGGLGGLAFWVLGVPAAAFWGAVMVVLSVLPLVGGALVWVPAAVILALSGQLVKGIVLAAFCGLVVGSVDNVLRPRLVGRDTQMHDLMILFSTLGGLMVFGPIGFIVGPIVAALFQTVWALFAVAYHDVLSPPAPMPAPEAAAAAVDHLVAPVVRPAPLPAEPLEPPRSIVGS